MVQDLLRSRNHSNTLPGPQIKIKAKHIKYSLDELPVNGLSQWRTWTWYENTTAAVGLGALCDTWTRENRDVLWKSNQFSASLVECVCVCEESTPW